MVRSGFHIVCAFILFMGLGFGVVSGCRAPDSPPSAAKPIPKDEGTRTKATPPSEPEVSATDHESESENESEEPGDGYKVDGIRPGASPRCKDDVLPAFPHPAPKPSARMALSDSLVRSLLGERPSPRLKDMADALDRTLSAAGYAERAYFSVRRPGQTLGFALVTRLERIRTDGAPFPPEERFMPATAPDRFNLADFLKSLFVAPVGYYRLLAFVVSTAPVRTDGQPMDSKGADALMERGDRRLRGCVADLAMTSDHSVDVLIYEFRHAPEEQTEDQQVAQLAPGRLDPVLHLSQAGVFTVQQLRKSD